SRMVAGHWIPIFLALSTGAGVIASLLLGKLYDRAGIWIVVTAVCLSASFSPLVFLGGFWIALGGLLLWGIGYATQDTLLKALIAGVLPEGKRGLAFGVFYLGYGGGWLAGSITVGLLYAHSRTALIAFSLMTQLLAVPFFILAAKGAPSKKAIAR